MPLTAYYPLDESSGDAQDYSGNEFNGTLNGGVTQDAPGILGTSAYEFNGTDGYINVGDVGLIETKVMSVSGWFNSSDSTNIGWIYTERNSADFNPLIQFGLRPDVINVSLRDNTGTFQDVSGDISSDGNWHFACATLDGSTAKLYLDGEIQGSTPIPSGSIAVNTTDIGATNQNGTIQNYMDGKISNVRVYDHALTAGEVQYLYEVSQSANFTTDKRLL